ncbi:MAG: DUF3108 domain-containing protein [Myxococcaceae bacterium]|nr:DUF3108 domain-containing protein [Myxococcaceae bacterium]
MVSVLAVAAVVLAAPDAGAAVVEAIPGDAECRPLPAWRGPIAFGPGEVLEYDLDALGAKAGRMTMSVKPPREQRLAVEVAIETNTFFSKVRRVKGSGTSYLNSKTLKPVRYWEDAMENEVHRTAEVTFEPHLAHLVATMGDRRGEADLPFGADGLDVAGAIYLMRQLPLKQGTALCFDIYGIRRIWRVWGTVQPREHVSLPVGEFEAWHLAGQAARLDMPNARREVHVWISDDPRRLPLAALGSIDVGTIRATLTGFNRPGDRTKEAENKANIKW